MASIVSAGTTSATALNMSADTTGILQLASNNGTVGLTLDTSQNVLLGSGTARNRLTVQGTVFSTPTLGTASGNAFFGETSGYGMMLGTSGFGYGWIQQQRVDGSATPYDLILQPVGGNLMVNATAQPLAANVKMYVNGQFASTCMFVGNGNAGSGAGFFSANTWFIQNESASLYRSYSCGTTGGSATGSWEHYSATSAGSPTRVFTASVTGFNIPGALSKGSGSFRIDHPLPQLEATHQLVHSFIEGPQADLIYRGKVNLVNGSATVNIDVAATMTEGTFVTLCRDVQCFTTNESDWTAVRGSVSGNILTIEAEDSASTASISWMVIGERQDKHMMDTGWTDENGKVIVEPLKPPVDEPQVKAGA